MEDGFSKSVDANPKALSGADQTTYFNHKVRTQLTQAVSAHVRSDSKALLSPECHRTQATHHSYINVRKLYDLFFLVVYLMT